MRLSELFGRRPPSSATTKWGRKGSSPVSLDEAAPERIPLAQCPIRRRCVVAGTVLSVLPSDPSHPACTKADLDDGSGQILRLVWLGPREIVGVAEGTALRAEGTIQLRDGHLSMVDPSYTVLSGGPQ